MKAEHAEVLRLVMMEDIDAINSEIIDAFEKRVPDTYSSGSVLSEIRNIRRRTNKQWWEITRADLEAVKDGKTQDAYPWKDCKKTILFFLEVRQVRLLARNMGRAGCCRYCERPVSAGTPTVQTGHLSSCPIVQLTTVIDSVRRLDDFEVDEED